MLDAEAQKDADHHNDVNDRYTVQSVKFNTSSSPSVVAGETPSKPVPGHLCTVSQCKAALMCCIACDFIYRQSETLPYTVTVYSSDAILTHHACLRRLFEAVTAAD